MALPDRERWKLLSPLLDELLDLAPAARRTRLEELRALDAALAQELEAMLGSASLAQNARFLSTDAQEDPSPATLIGTQLGAYVIDALLGQGGTGSVWRAHRADGRYQGAVAVKLLHLSLIGRAGAFRFEREGAILARLTHLNIARLLDAGVTASGQPYLVLELVEGERIDRHCDANRLNVEQRLALFDAVLAAVAHAHSHLVIHRDIKPSNILVAADGTVKLLDFGIAKLLEDDPGDTPLTAQGHRALTPGYAAPEQLMGAPVTTATDVYALGVLLYQLLVGRHPVAAEASSPAEVLRATLEAEPPRLTTALAQGRPGQMEELSRVASERSTALARLRRQLSGDLENITARTLRKNPAERYQTVEALAEDLRRHRDHQPVSARPDSLGYRLAKFVRRNRSMVAAALLVLLAVAAGVTGTVTQARRARAQALEAQRERDNALRQLDYADSANEFIGFLLEESSDKPFTTPELLARGEGLVEQQFGGNPALCASLELILGSLYSQASEPQKATEVLGRARAMAQRVKDPALLSNIECQLATEEGTAGGFDPARAKIDVALARARAAPEPDSDVIATCLFGRSELDNLAGDAQAALDDGQAALAALGTPRIGQRMTDILIRTAIADAQNSLGRHAEGTAGYERAIAELEAMGRGKSRITSTMYADLGTTLARSGQVLRAVQSNQHALELLNGFGGTGSDPTLEGNYTRLLVDLGRYREAMAAAEHARKAALADGNTLSAGIIALQGAPAFCATGALDRCAELIATAEASFTGVLKPTHSRFGVLRMAQAQLALARGDLPRARDLLKQAVATFENAKDRNPTGIRARTLLARTEQQLGELDAAEGDASKAVTQARAAMAGFAHSEWLGSALLAQGMIQKARGNTAQAEATWREAVEHLHDTLGDAAPATVEAQRLLAGM